MAAQYDFSSGLDISGLTSVTQAQLMQMVNQLAPLSNIGGIIWGSTTPDVVGNPRFARYIWIDTTATPATIKVWSGAAWVPGSIGTGSISLATQIADNIIPFSKFLKSEATANQVLHKNSTNTAFEFVAPVSLFAAGDIAVNKLSIAGAVAGQFLRYTAAGGVSWNTYDPTGDVSALPVNKLAVGSASQILRINPTTGLAEWVSNDDATSSLLAPGGGLVGINVSKLAASGSASGDLLKSNGTNWVKATPAFNIFESNSYIDCDIDLSALITAGFKAVVHGFSAKPKSINLVVRCLADDAATAYVASDFIDPLCFGCSAAIFAPQVSCAWDATNIVFFAATVCDRLRKKTSGVLTAPTNFSNFKLRAYILT